MGQMAEWIAAESIAAVEALTAQTIRTQEVLRTDAERALRAPGVPAVVEPANLNTADAALLAP